ncbi:DUF4439 domain-containing protein [Corynebacterium sp. P6129]|uniref:DUF4439 domain-containing protein n=1 Tax=Corynebacterium antarcticum TaxID=2800405 RepID=UPI002260BCF0|nr:DUF4439 domain-containing protein [Corynebacterium antarcticum]MCX7491244.1 DUF4439 domain-containing protein [Corynebacterium antarcticum]
MKRRSLRSTTITPVTALFLAGVLTACAISPEPEADPALFSLSADAHADAAELSGSDPRGAEVRERHAEALDAEIRRLCGVLEDGTVPDSCTVPTATGATVPTGTGSADVLPESAEQIAREAASAPRESVLKLARMHGELAVLTGTTPEPESSTVGDLVGEAEFEPDPADLEAALKALEWQYSAIYGLEVAQSWADTEVAASIGRSVEGHRELATQLRELLSGIPESRLPLPAAGYGMPEDRAPADAGSALATAVRIETDSVLMWQADAATAEQPAWRVWYILAGSTAALRSVPVLAAAGTDPAAEGLFDLG